MTLRAAGHEAVWAGGCVRDQLLGVVPADYDIATSATPAEVMAIFPRHVPVGVQFGVVRVHVDELEFEVATFRAEAGYQDGRRPTDVRWANAREDVLRRDFTINGLLYDPVDDVVIDFVDGRRDLAAGIIRAIGDPAERFAEDHLRILRAVRFAARFDFVIDPPTWRAVCRGAAQVAEVSAERVHGELTRCFSEGGARVALGLLERAALRPVLLPELEAVDRAIARAPQGEPLDAGDAWATVLADVASDETIVALGRRLRWSKALIREVAGAVAIAREIDGYEALSLAAQKRLLRHPQALRGLDLADRRALANQLEADRVARARADHARWTEAELRPSPLLGGADLRRAGYSPGPGFRLALTAIEDGQLGGTVRSEPDAWRVVHAVLGPAPG